MCVLGQVYKRRDASRTMNCRTTNTTFYTQTNTRAHTLTFRNPAMCPQIDGRLDAESQSSRIGYPHFTLVAWWDLLRNDKKSTMRWVFPCKRMKWRAPRQPENRRDDEKLVLSLNCRPQELLCFGWLFLLWCELAAVIRRMLVYFGNKC